MPRKKLRPRERREIISPDYKYNNVLVARFISKLNFQGKKTLAERIVYSVFDSIKEKTKQDPMKVFSQSVENVRPLVVVKARRVGGATYQIPLEVKKFRGETLALRWIIQYARQRKGIPVREKLTEEIISAYKREGPAIKKREDTHRMAEANKAFAHYRW